MSVNLSVFSAPGSRPAHIGAAAKTPARHEERTIFLEVGIRGVQTDLANLLIQFPCNANLQKAAYPKPLVTNDAFNEGLFTITKACNYLPR